MPWDCTLCEVEVETDDGNCPSCGITKAAWTVIANKTRVMVISKKGFRLLRADGSSPVEPAETAYDGLELTVAAEGRVLPKEDVLELHEDGEAPAPEDVLFVEIKRSKSTDLGVKLEVLHASKPPDEHEFPRTAEAGEPETALVRFLLAYGDESLDGVDFPGTAPRGRDRPHGCGRRRRHLRPGDGGGGPGEETRRAALGLWRRLRVLGLGPRAPSSPTCCRPSYRVRACVAGGPWHEVHHLWGRLGSWASFQTWGPRRPGLRCGSRAAPPPSRPSGSACAPAAE